MPAHIYPFALKGRARTTRPDIILYMREARLTLVQLDGLLKKYEVRNKSA